MAESKHRWVPVLNTDKERCGDCGVNKGDHLPVVEAQGLIPDMTLRDYFAAAALTGLVAAPEAMMGMREVGKDYGMGVEQYASRMAYEMADAMLKERQEFRS